MEKNGGSLEDSGVVVVRGAPKFSAPFSFSRLSDFSKKCCFERLVVLFSFWPL